VAAIDGPSAAHGDGSSGTPFEHRNELQGDVFGAAVQARDVHGGIHVYQSRPALPTPSQLPPPVHLCGRSRDLAALDAASSGRTVIITGPPGIGKTALAVRWGHARRDRYPDGQLYADLHGHSPEGPVLPTEILAGFLGALGVLPENLPGDLAGLTALYRSLTSDRRLVVVLDDAISAAQVRPLLPTSTESTALITSRWRLASLIVAGARMVQLDRLESAEAIELLSYVLGEDRIAVERAAADELAGLCAYFPLPLCISAARLVVRPRWRISQLVHELRLEQRRLSAFAVEEDLAVRAALDLSYRALPVQAARMYRMMSLFPGASFGSQLAAATTAMPVNAASRLLGVLVDANMLDDAVGGRYRYHDLIKLHALATAEEEETDAVRSAALRRMLDWCLAAVAQASQIIAPSERSQMPAFPYRPTEPLRLSNDSDALDWLEQELPNLTAAVSFASDHGYPDIAWQIVDALWPLFLRRGHYPVRLVLDRIGLVAARRSGDVAAEAKMLGRYGLILTSVRRLDEAAECYNQALAIWSDEGNGRGIASSLRRLGLVEHTRGRIEEALDAYRRSLDAYERLGESRATALMLTDIGSALIDADRAIESVEYLRRAEEILAEGADSYNWARALATLGRALSAAGNMQEAASVLEQALSATRQARSLTGEARVLLLLGDLDLSATRPAEATQRYSAALEILIQIGSPRAGEARDRLARLRQTD
jgi:tetratricopeptide (TPR) repeat protein